MKQCLAAVIAVLTCGSVAAAQLEDLVPRVDGAMQCWTRDYDAAHLKAHPDQEVARMNFLIARIPDGPDYGFQLGVEMRDGRVGHNTGPCTSDDGQIWCGVECDGGYVMVEPRADGSVLLDLETSGYIYLSGGCGAEDEDAGFALESGQDDKSFLLRPGTVAMCDPARLD